MTRPDAPARAAFSRATRHGMPADGILLYVSVTRQEMHVTTKAGIQQRYRISSSKYGTGSQANSNKTPLGWHEIADRIGTNAGPGQVFVARKPVNGRIIAESEWKKSQSEDLVLTRIMRLKGRQPGKNSGNGIDSYNRFIYIHGTNQEQLLGTPASHGCIRMSNRDVIKLFTLTDGVATWCLIDEN